MQASSAALGVVLAGGAARRLGGDKAGAELGGRPLIGWPLAAFAAAGLERTVVAKRDSPLPPGLGVPVVREPDEPRHPLAGIVAALSAHAGPIVVCACDMPFVTPDVLAELGAARGTTVCFDGQRLQPLLARYEQGDEALLRAALAAGRPATESAAALEPALLRVAPELAASVNTPGQLERARKRLADMPMR